MAKYRKYSKEFKLQAARLVTEQGYSYKQAAKRLGTTGWSIRNWVQKFRHTGELPSQSENLPKVLQCVKFRECRLVQISSLAAVVLIVQVQLLVLEESL